MDIPQSSFNRSRRQILRLSKVFGLILLAIALAPA